METSVTPTISLCVIAGNEAAHIERMLESFGPAFSELSLVRAVGSSIPDETVSLARAWCTRNGKGFIFDEYLNAPDLQQWDHVDDFAAARNLSFEQATGAWLMWADCDDVCESPEAIRGHVAEGRDMLMFPYHVPMAGKTTARERLIRAETFRAGRHWRSPVHETINVLPGDTWTRAALPVWRHEPIGPKAGGSRRNLNILGASLAGVPDSYYYCHQEHFYLGSYDKAQRFGSVFLSLPRADDKLKYQCLLNMAQMSGRKDEAAQYALRAWYLYPHAREAVASLVLCALQDERAEQALYFAQQMVAIPEPTADARQWWHEPRWYGWAGTDLYQRAVRYSGSIRFKHDGAEGFKLALVHATRGREQQAIHARDAWMLMADDPYAVEHIFSIDADDKNGARHLRQFWHRAEGKGNSVSAWNSAAEWVNADILIQLSDDWAPFRGWDTAILKACAGRDPKREQFVIAVSDGHRTDDLLCMAIMSRARYEAQGSVMFSPEYESVYSDNEFSHRAFKDGVVIDARKDITFNHLHPAFGAGQMDATYASGNTDERYARGRETFLRRNPEAKL